MMWDVPFVEDANTDGNTLIRHTSAQNMNEGIGMGVGKGKGVGKGMDKGKLKGNVALSANPMFVCSGTAGHAGACRHRARALMHACMCVASAVLAPLRWSWSTCTPLQKPARGPDHDDVHRLYQLVGPCTSVHDVHAQSAPALIMCSSTRPGFERCGHSFHATPSSTLQLTLPWPSKTNLHVATDVPSAPCVDLI